MASDKVQQAVERFVGELRAIIAEEARATLLAVLGQPTARRASPAAPRRAQEARHVTGPEKRTAGKRVRRSAEDLEAVQEKLLAVLKKQPGANSEQIQEASGLSKADIQRPLTLLREAGDVRTEGEKRAMRYYLAGRG